MNPFLNKVVLLKFYLKSKGKISAGAHHFSNKKKENTLVAVLNLSFLTYKKCTGGP